MKKLSDAPLITDDEDWKNSLRGIKKIKQPEIPLGAEPPLIIGEMRHNIDYAQVYSGNSLKTLKSDAFDNVDKRTAEKLRKGEFKIERRLDLHGLTEKEASEAVCNFVLNAYRQNLRCILIITGKGLQKETDDWYEKKGILKESLPNWLNSSELRPLVLAFCQAIPEDGGSGAFYILLRRKRKTS